MGKYLNWIKKNILNEKMEAVSEIRENKDEQTKINEVSKEKIINTIFISHMDDLFWEAGRFLIGKENAYISFLQREFKIGFNRAIRIMEELCEAGIVGEELGTKPREILIGLEEFEYLRLSNKIQAKTGIEENGNQREEIKQSYQFDRVSMYNNKYDYMTGEDFEIFIARILGNIGFSNIQLTRGSGDQGVDILAEKDNIKYAFQCKRYDKPVGNKAVQEVFAGKFFYHCHVGVVVTNNYFTQSAKDLAHENGVVLWDRDYIQKFINNKDERNRTYTEKEALRQYNENRGKGDLRILDIEEKIIAIEDGNISKCLYQYLEDASRISIDMYLENGDGNPYTEDMIRCAERPIELFNAKSDISLGTIQFVYFCGMKTDFKNTGAFEKLLNISKENNREYKDNLFKIDVFYKIKDVFLDKEEISIGEMPEVDISTDDMETIELLESIDEYDLQTGYKLLVTENFFPMKLDNIKFE